MNTKIVLTSCALFLGLLGILLTFLPMEIVMYLHLGRDRITVLLLQMIGAQYLGFGMLNWMMKNSRIGGIYNKPLILGNLTHFLVSTLTLLKILPVIEAHFKGLLVITMAYGFYSIFFVYVFVKSPVKEEQKNSKTSRSIPES
ncbi:hypothetical protein QSE00_22395 [Arenibacter sp. M-2]|uniref:hypothetical protein n=1 Tax=Arenibacter sp. M-2 TaxID=3053612 RepID=UPI00256FA814|nr:hypothetical protein [Arenibacter sp. M-2]MDL5514579.1 hypothetical protein [Arenibacter sp. M-2]